MKHFLLLVWLLAGHPAFSATYYLATNGDDSRTPAQAQNPATPWQSLARLNAAMPLLLPGDQVLLRRGDVFRGQLVISRSGASGAPLVFGAYGLATAAAPVLSGSIPLNGWVSVGPSLWEAPCPAGTAVTGLYAANGKPLPLGRYPNPTAANKGYLTIASHTGNTGLTAPALAGGSWTGATAVVRSIRWVLDRAPVTGQSGATLTLGAFESPYYTSGGLPDGWGFFLQNHPATLDQNGEWYHYPARNVLRIYAASAPASGTLEATTAAPAGVVIRNQSHVTLENLTIARTPRVALDGLNVAHLVVRGVQVLGADENGVMLSGSGSNVLLEDCLIRGVNNNAVSVVGYSDVVFRNNTLRRTGTVPGRGLSGDGQYYTFNVTDGNRVTLENNTLDSCGYVGLAYFRISNITIARNVVSNFCLVKDDGGGIYTYNGGTPFPNLNARIVDNIVFNGVGAPEGTAGQTYLPANGIYLDDCTRNVTVQGNTVAECGYAGIFMHGNSTVTVRDNTCFNNGSQLVIAAAGPCTSTGLTVQNNVLVSARRDDLAADFYVPRGALTQLGTLSGNYYAQPFNSTAHFRYENQHYLLSEWQTLARQDAGSSEGAVRFRPYRFLGFSGPEKLFNGALATDIGGWGSWSSSGRPVLAWDNTNALGSGGSLRIASAAPSATGTGIMQANKYIGAVAQGTSYVVRFNARCSAGAKLLEVFLQQGNVPYRSLTPSNRMLALTPTTQLFEVALPATENYADALVSLQTAEDNRTVWVDNVTVRPATLAPASAADSVRLEYNATSVPRTVALPAGARYADVRNVPFSGSFTLAPFTSVVLFRLNGSRPAATRAAAAPAVALWPNPTTGTSTLDLRALPAGNYQTTLVDATGRAVRRYTLTGGHTNELSLAGLPAGVFLLRGQGAGTSFSVRVVKE